MRGTVLFKCLLRGSSKHNTKYQHTEVSINIDKTV